ncbi:PepSY-associated TM helix domain-containing protein [Sphingomonas oligophenolica]|uniref:PepSY domain-containing protein n=1 Tax=Sphingomonas oligophenolica TaxID=301154 RepID=A0A502CM00_9SPHN|nr:PepSY-associated TM helix domain-containing protein [Sphingomonas oligophenolica]TPG13159.1 PepSY domain-containing protein [Sphingomonas oligophenolica]
MTTIALRRAWFQVHKWIGLALAILIIPLSLSGAALVWDEGLDRAINPDRYAVSGTAIVAPDTYVAAARAVLAPGDRIATLTLPGDEGPVSVVASRAATTDRPGPPARMTVYLDPPSARVLAVASGNGGLVRFLHRLHGSLQIPGVGRSVVGSIGVFMMVSSLTGLWLWWPTKGSLKRAFRWGRHRHLDTNIHQTFGFWIALPLFVLSLTGAWISFPGFSGALTGEAPRGERPRTRPVPLATPAQSIAAVIARARGEARGNLRSIAWPTTTSPDWTVTFAGARQPIKVADDSGVASAAPERDRAKVGRLMRRIHDGTGMGAAWQTVIVVGGILPAVLAMTGVIMWWRNRGWRAMVKARLAARG